MTDLDQIAKDGPQDFGSGIGEPLRTPLFRRIWSASLLSNLGLLVQAVGAGWLMTQLTSAVSMAALVQTALMLPIMLVSVPAGAIADMYDKRKVGIFVLSVSFAGAALLTLTTAFQWITPWSLLGFCFLIGSGSALFSPAWQSSVSEQVPSHALPQAVALNSISYNIARSFGPAIGGVIVAAAARSLRFCRTHCCISRSSSCCIDGTGSRCLPDCRPSGLIARLRQVFAMWSILLRSEWCCGGQRRPASLAVRCQHLCHWLRKTFLAEVPRPMVCC